jgi:dienelactone hydrolase
MLRRLVLPLLALASAFTPVFASAQSPTWDQLKAVYDVKPLADSDVKSQDRTASEGTYTEFNFPSENGGTAFGTFVRPNTKGPFPLVILLHGLGGNRKFMIDSFAKAFLAKGFAVMALDAPHHGDRATPDDGKLLQATIMKFAMSKDRAQGLGAFMATDPTSQKFATDAIEIGVRDIRRAIDWITIPGHRVEAKQIGAMGISMGSIMASILSGVDDRINADMLVIGGDPIAPFIDKVAPDLQLTAAAGASSLFLGHSTAHVLMLNGYNDGVIPRADVQRLYESAPGATLMFFDTPGDTFSGLGHSITAEGYAFGEDWLERMISVPKPDKRTHSRPVGGP